MLTLALTLTLTLDPRPHPHPQPHPSPLPLALALPKVELIGHPEVVDLARLCIQITLQQRKGSGAPAVVYSDLERREDVEYLDVPEKCVGFILGAGGATLRQMEEKHKVFMFFDNDNIIQGRDGPTKRRAPPRPAYAPPRSRAPLMPPDALASSLLHLFTSSPLHLFASSSLCLFASLPLRLTAQNAHPLDRLTPLTRRAVYIIGGSRDRNAVLEEVEEAVSFKTTGVGRGPRMGQGWAGSLEMFLPLIVGPGPAGWNSLG